MQAQLQALLSADRGDAIAATWVIAVAVAFSAPAAIAWCLAVRRGSRR